MAKKKKSTNEIEEMVGESNPVKKAKLASEEPETKIATNGKKTCPVAKEDTPKEESEDSESSSDSDSDDKSSSDSDSDSDESDDDDDDEDNVESKKEPVEVVKDETPLTPINSISNASPVKVYSVPDKSSSSDSYHSDTEEEDKKRRKKQKKLQQIQLTKKIKRTMSRRNSRSEFFDIDKDDEDENIQNNCADMPDWPSCDFSELLQRIETQVPVKDNLKFDSRASKLDWNKIRFNNYTANECYDVWLRITKRIRRFRTLRDMLGDAKDWITKPWTNFYRGPKKNRHPDMPSRPLSTYMIYYLDHKDKIASENPGVEMTQISKIISEMYKTLSQEEREKYAEMAAKERQNFEEKLSEFYKDHPEMVPQSQNRASAKERYLKGPKKPSVPFKLFFQNELKRRGDEIGAYDRKLIEEESKEKWRSLSDKKKLLWINWALEDLKRYETELRKYRLDHPDFVPPAGVKSFLNKDERCIKERLAGKPIKPPNSAYSLFSRLILQSDEDVKLIPPKERMAEVSRKWKLLTEEKKLHYEEQVRELQEQYKLEFASYLEGLTAEEREEELKKHQPKRKSAAAAAAAANANDDGDPGKKAPVKREAKRRSSKPAKKPITAAKTTSKGSRPSTRSATRAASKSVTKAKKEVVQDEDEDAAGLQLYMGEPAPPPVRVFDLFLQTFLKERPSGTSEETRLKEAPRYWEILPEAKKENYRKKLTELKQKYIEDYEIFLKGLSPEQLKEFSMLKNKAKQREEAQEHLEQVNGALSDAETDEDKNNSSNQSGSEGTKTSSDSDTEG